MNLTYLLTCKMQNSFQWVFSKAYSPTWVALLYVRLSIWLRMLYTQTYCGTNFYWTIIWGHPLKERALIMSGSYVYIFNSWASLWSSTHPIPPWLRLNLSWFCLWSWLLITWEFVSKNDLTFIFILEIYS